MTPGELREHAGRREHWEAVDEILDLKEWLNRAADTIEALAREIAAVKGIQTK